MTRLLFTIAFSLTTFFAMSQSHPYDRDSIVYEYDTAGVAIDSSIIVIKFTIPDPQVTWAGDHQDGYVFKNTLLTDSALVVIQNHDYHEFFYEVTSFEVIWKAKYNLYKERVIGPVISPNMRNMFASAQPGDKLIFTNVQLKGGLWSKYRLVPPFEFTIY